MVNSFYDKFVLRDFFGKIVPGFILCMGIITCLSRANTVILSPHIALKELPFLITLAMFGIFWLVGFSIQCFGETTKLFRYFPEEVFDSEKEFFKFRKIFIDHASQHQIIQLERFNVIKEACGNGYVSLLLTSFITVNYWLVSLISNPTLSLLGLMAKYKYEILTFIITLVIIYFLRGMHMTFVRRQYDFMSSTHQELPNQKKRTSISTD